MLRTPPAILGWTAALFICGLAAAQEAPAQRRIPRAVSDPATRCKLQRWSTRLICA